MMVDITPEKCGTCYGKGMEPRNFSDSPCQTCHGKGFLYPSALVKRIRSLKLSIGLPRSDSESFLYWQLTEEDAVAVLDALNTETE